MPWMILLLLTAQILTWDDYRSLAVKPDGIIRLESLLYYGARHSRQPEDPQFEEITRLWAIFRPTVALVEGGVPPVAPSGREAILKFGETGFVRYLAQRDRVTVKSIDPPFPDQVAALLEIHPAERVKLFFLLRGLVDGRPPENEMARISAVKGLEGSPRSWEVVAALVPEWRSADPSWFDPTREGRFTQAINRDLSQFRNRFMVATVQEELRRGARVFAVAGRTHVIMQTPAFRPQAP